MWMLHNNKGKLTNFGASSVTANFDQKVMKAELLFSGFLVEHNLPLSIADHTAKKLFRKMFPDSKITYKYWCGHTKTTTMLTEAVEKQTTSNLKEDLLFLFLFLNVSYRILHGHFCNLAN